MNKKIKFYKTLSPAEINVNIGHLARILFDNFSYVKVENKYNKKIYTDNFGHYSIVVDEKTGFFEFEDVGRMHNNTVIKNFLPKNAQEAKEMAMRYFNEKDSKIQNDYHLKKINFPRIFKYVEFINAFPVQHKSFPRIDHWECLFKFSLLSKNNYRISLEQHELVIKLCNRGDVIGLKYHHIPILEENWVSPAINNHYATSIANIKERCQAQTDDLTKQYNDILKEYRQTYETEIVSLKAEITNLKQELKNQKNNG